MAYFNGTLISAPIVKGSSLNPYGTHHSVLGVGGYMEVNTIAERNALPVDFDNDIYFDGISSGQRRIGMLVFVLADNNTYQLSINITQWNGYITPGQKLNALNDNNNWVLYPQNKGIGENISKNINQINHGFIIGDVIGNNGIIYLKVNNITGKEIEPLGIVSNIMNVDNFKLIYSGNININNIFDSIGGILIYGTTYYLSEISGKITSLQPTSITAISKPVLQVTSNGNGVVLQYRSRVKTDNGVDFATYNSYVSTTQTFLDTTITGATNNGNTGSSPILLNKVGHNLILRSIKSLDTNMITITYDDNNIYLLGNIGGTLTGTTTAFTDSRTEKVGLIYGGDYSATFTDRSLIDKGYADKLQNVKNVLMATGVTPYYATASDYFIGARGGDTIYLPQNPISGRNIVVADVIGNAFTTNILINGYGKNILNGTESSINTSYGSVTLIYNGIFWSLISFSS